MPRNIHPDPFFSIWGDMDESTVNTLKSVNVAQTQNNQGISLFKVPVNVFAGQKSVAEDTRFCRSSLFICCSCSCELV